MSEKLLWICAYSACSSTMLVINKIAVHHLPLPTIVSGAQLVAASLLVVFMEMCGSKVVARGEGRGRRGRERFGLFFFCKPLRCRCAC